MDTYEQAPYGEGVASPPVSQPGSPTTRLSPDVVPATSFESAMQDIERLFMQFSTRSPSSRASASRTKLSQSSSSRATAVEANPKHEMLQNGSHSQQRGPKSPQSHISSYTRRRIQRPGAWLARLFGYDNLKEVLEESNMDPNSTEAVAEANALLYSSRAEAAYVRMRK